MRNRLLSGGVRPLTLRLAGPSLLAMLSTGLANLLDALFAARAGAALSGAMSVCFPLLTLIQTVGFTLGMGAGSHVSRCLGDGDADSARRVASTATALALALGLLLAGMGALLAPQAALWLGAPQEELDACAGYARRVLPRSVRTVDTRFGSIRIKCAPGKAAPEYEDCRQAARAGGAPIMEVYEAARGAAETP